MTPSSPRNAQGTAPEGAPTVVAEIILTRDRRLLAEHVEIANGLVTATGQFARRRQPTGTTVTRTWGPTDLVEIRWTETDA